MGRAVSTELREEIVYGRDHDHVRIFISSRMGTTLDAERKITADAVDSVAGHKAWWWEQDAAMGVLHSEHECVSYARASAGLILLIDGALSKIVHAEYDAARQGGANRFVLIRGEGELPDEVRQFVTAQRGEAVTRNFQNADELTSIVYQALTRALVRSLHEGTFARREHLRGGDDVI